MWHQCNTCRLLLSPDKFYKHPKAANGLLPRCKVCQCASMRMLRRENPDRLSAYEKARYVGERREKMVIAARVRAQRDPIAYLARTAVNNAVRDGRLAKPSACSRCARSGVRIEGHHDDYAKPLDVRWFCARCHRRHHAENPSIPF